MNIPDIDSIGVTSSTFNLYLRLWPVFVLFVIILLNRIALNKTIKLGLMLAKYPFFVC